MNFFDERFWLAISLIAFIYLAYRPAKKAIIKLLDDKVAAIKSQVLEAEGLKRDAKILLEKVEQDLGHLETQREEILQTARANADKLMKERENEIEAFLEHKKGEILNTISNQKLKAGEQVQLEFVMKVTQLVTEYFKVTKNSSLSDKELAQNLLDQKKSNDSIL